MTPAPKDGARPQASDGERSTRRRVSAAACAGQAIRPEHPRRKSQDGAPTRDRAFGWGVPFFLDPQRPLGSHPAVDRHDDVGMIRIATMFAILIIGLIAFGRRCPLVRIADGVACDGRGMGVGALAAVEGRLRPASPRWASHAPPPEVIAIARKRPVTIVLMSSPPSMRALITPTMIGESRSVRAPAGACRGSRSA